MATLNSRLLRVASVALLGAALLVALESPLGHEVGIAHAQDASTAASVTTPAASASAATAPATNASTATNPGGTQTNQVANSPSCNPLTGAFFLNFFTCIGAQFSGFIGGILVGISATFLEIAGWLFDWIFNKTVLQFGDFVNQNVISSVNTAWSAFRDLANIVIIAMFVYVAIQTILGSHEYGARKMIARLLIVAVLINFSLLFTKLIIDGSNFFAVQFYSATMPQNTGGGSGTDQTASISGAFESIAGVSGFGDTRAIVVQMAKDPNVGFVKSLMYGVFVAILFLAGAVIFLYGSFLLLARAILMIFLMITSSIAFGTYLIPGAAKSKFGWSAWWSSLLNNALLAPLLMVFLWVSLIVGKNFHVSSGSPGDLIANPSNSSDLNALVAYLIVIGLLFISFRVSSSFSKQIGGFDYAALLPAFAYGRGLQGAGLLGSLVIGGPAAGLANQFKQRRDREEEGSWRHMLYNFGTQQADKIAKRDMNLARTAIGSAIKDTAGIKGADAFGAKGHGFDGMKHAVSDAAAKYGAAVGISAKRAKEIEEQVRGEVLKQNPALKQEHDSSQAEKHDAEQTVQAEQQSLKSMQERHDNQMQAITRELKQAVQAAAQGQAGAVQRQTEIEAQKKQTELDHQRQLQEQTQRIKEATQISERANRIHERVLDKVTQVARDEHRIPEKFAGAQQAATRSLDRSLTRAILQAAQLGMGDDHEFAHHAEEALKKTNVKKQLKESGFEDFVKDITKGSDAGHAAEHKEEAPSKPATPAPDAHH